MHDMPYEDDAWDAIVSGWAIAYSDNKRKAAMEMVRVCKPGGVIGVGVEYNPLSTDQIGEVAGYVPGSEERVEDLDQLLALYAPHVNHVYYAHQPTPQRRDRKGSIVAVFSVNK
jgi:ubiquinone/menaquinone biosynthesis C-methylase UbiE